MPLLLTLLSLECLAPRPFFLSTPSSLFSHQCRGAPPFFIHSPSLFSHHCTSFFNHSPFLFPQQCPVVVPLPSFYPFSPSSTLCPLLFINPFLPFLSPVLLRPSFFIHSTSLFSHQCLGATLLPFTPSPPFLPPVVIVAKKWTHILTSTLHILKNHYCSRDNHVQENVSSSFFWSCWLDVQYGVIWAFAGPVICVLLVNTIMFFMALVIARKSLQKRSDGGKMTSNTFTLLKGKWSLRKRFPSVEQVILKGIKSFR